MHINGDPSTAFANAIFSEETIVWNLKYTRGFRLEEGFTDPEDMQIIARYVSLKIVKMRDE